MAEHLTPRARARAANIERIKALALEQLREAGAGELSLRAIARELSIVSSAIYRYFASRDDLITALVADAYDDLGATLEAAGAAAGGDGEPRARFEAVAGAWRRWALEQPHRFSLIYGSAIPGYVAPPTTIAPAARVLAAFAAPVVEAERSGLLPPAVPATGGSSGEVLRGQLDDIGAVLAPELGAGRVLALVGAFAQVVGVIGLELNGHLVGGFEPADELFAALVDRQADALGWD